MDIEAAEAVATAVNTGFGETGLIDIGIADIAAEEAEVAQKFVEIEKQAVGNHFADIG